MAVQVASELADADGVDLTASESPSVVDAGSVALRLTVEGAAAAVDTAIATIRAALPAGSSIEILEVLDEGDAG